MSTTAELVADREIVMRRTFPAGREAVYRAFTDAEQVGRWWGPEGFTTITTEMDVRRGGIWRHVMIGPDGTRYPNRIRYTEVVAPERLAWTHDEDEDGSRSFDVVVTFEAETDARTTVTLRQIHATAEARDYVVREFHAIEGGKQTLARLAAHLDDRAAAQGGSALGETLVTAPSDRELRVVRTFDAPRGLVWDAWTSPEHVPHWLLGPDGWTMPICEVDLRPGGAWRYRWEKPDGTEGFEMHGEYREVVAPERVVHTEIFEGEESLNTLVFTEEGGRTRVELTVLYPSAEHRDGALGTGMLTGMNRSFDRLDERLRTVWGRTA